MLSLPDQAARAARVTLFLFAALVVPTVACGGAIDTNDPGSAGAAAGGSGSGAATGGGGGTGAGTGTGTGTGPTPVPGPGAPGSPAPADGPWGTWQLTGLDGPPGQLDPKAPPALELSLRPDGTAVRYRCARSDARPDPAAPPYPAPCPAASTYECLVGKVFWDGGHWRVDIPAIRVGNVPEQGEIVPETGGGVLVRYIYPTYSIGHFQRFSGDPSPIACEAL